METGSTTNTALLEAIKLADLAARQSDRWATYFMFFLWIAFMTVVLKIGFSKLTSYHDDLKKIQEGANLATIQTALAIQSNATATGKNTEVLERLEKEISRQGSGR